MNRRKWSSKKGQGEGIRWLLAHVNYKGDDCLPWPLSRDGRVGRGRVGYLGKQWWAHRLMCFLAHGEPPTPKHQAAHNCGRGHHGCVNPKHLEWKTNGQNQDDRWAFGNRQTNRSGTRGNLTPEQQAAIIALKGKKTQMDIAEQFGVSLGCVQYWHKWRAARGHDVVKKRNFTAAEEAFIRENAERGIGMIADHLGRTEGSVRARMFRMGL